MKHMLVCIKQVPDTTEIKIDPVKKTLIRDGVPSIVNPFDAYALELAARIKDNEPGSTITLVSMGPPQAEAALKTCLAVGGDKAYLVTGREFGGSDTLATSYILSCAVKKVRELEGHGVGTQMHEEPGVPNYGRRGHGARLVDGMTICIEPMICAGGRGVYIARNGWAVHTADHKNAAHYELTVVVRKGRAQQLSTFDYIEKDGSIKF